MSCSRLLGFVPCNICFCTHEKGPASGFQLAPERSEMALTSDCASPSSSSFALLPLTPFSTCGKTFIKLLVHTPGFARDPPFFNCVFLSAPPPPPPGRTRDKTALYSTRKKKQWKKLFFFIGHEGFVFLNDLHPQKVQHRSNR
jgi:hypothetical protein